MKARSFPRCVSSFVHRSRVPMLAAAGLLFALTPVPAQTSHPAARPAVLSLQKDFGKIPLSFEPNRGQTDPSVQFLSRGPGYALYLTGSEATLQLQKAPKGSAGTTAPPTASTTLRMKLAGGNTLAPVSGEDLLPGTVNYFTGADPAKWHNALPTYKRVSYKGVYPGVDLVYYGNQRELEYDFVVAPGANPAQIGIAFTGSTPKIDAHGDLVLAVAGGEARFHKPVVYQSNGDRRVPVQGGYQIADGKVGFALGRYDRSRPLVIDPVLSYLTYIGGTMSDQVNGMAVDTAGNVYLVGTTNSTNYPVSNAYQTTNPNTIASGNPLTIFVSKLNSTGTALVYSTYLGSSEYTYGNAIAVDAAGSVYVGGYTAYGNYPVTAGAYQTVCGGEYMIPQGSTTPVRANGCGGAGQGDTGATLTKLSPAGNTLVYSTYLSGNSFNAINAIAVDSAGQAFVTGVTNAHCGPGTICPFGTFPTTANAVQSGAPNTGDDGEAFFTEFNAAGSGLIYSSRLINIDPAGHYVSNMTARSIALDTAGNAYIAGSLSAGVLLQTTPGAYQSVPVANASPAFVAKFNPGGTTATSLAYATYLSGTTASNDVATGIALDSASNAVITGYTSSCTFPTTSGAFSTVPGGSISQNICAGGFLSKLNAAGSALVWSTYTGNNGANGRNNDDNDAVALGPDGSVYVAGDEQGVVLSPTVNPILVQSESHFAYIKQFKSDGSAVKFSTAVGGTTDATSLPAAIYVDASNNIYLAGSTNSATYPTTAGAFQKSSANPGINYNEGFVAKIAATLTSTSTLTLPAGVIAGQPATFTARVAGPTGTTTVPTGTVTFTSGSTTLGTATLNATGTATYTATSLNATTYTVVASYAGDSNFAASASASQALVVIPAAATVTLIAPATAIVGSSVTFTATINGTPGTPTGMVTFKDGTAILSMMPLAAGTASYTTSTLSAGPHSITATYGGDTVFAAATSAVTTVTVNVAAAISFMANPSTLTIPHGASGTVIITGTPAGGYAGTVSFACGTLPAAASCSFAPATLSFTGSNMAQSSTLTFSTITTRAQLESTPVVKGLTGVSFALLLLPLAARPRRRKGLRKLCLLSLALLAGVVGAASLSGCSSSATFGTATTPAGTYTVPVVITAGTTTSTINLNLTVQ